MALTNGDLKQLDLMMKKAVIEGTAEALEAIVFPMFENVDKKFENIGRRFEKIELSIAV